MSSSPTSHAASATPSTVTKNAAAGSHSAAGALGLVAAVGGMILIV
jgi:hypothetical protein